MLKKWEKFERYARFLVDAFVFGLIAILISKTGVSATQAGLRIENWRRNVSIGIAAGILLIATQSLFIGLSPINPRSPFVYAVRRGSVGLWVLIFIVGAFAEELWIAFCLVVLKTTWHSEVVYVCATVIVFAAVHYTYRWGVFAVAIKGTISCLLFLWCGSLIPTFLYHFIGNLGSLYWCRFWRRQQIS
jgi:hypothetical protein